MDMSDIDILWCVLLFAWIMYVWETYLSLRQVIKYALCYGSVRAPIKLAALATGPSRRNREKIINVPSMHVTNSRDKLPGYLNIIMHNNINMEGFAMG